MLKSWLTTANVSLDLNWSSKLIQFPQGQALRHSRRLALRHTEEFIHFSVTLGLHLTLCSSMSIQMAVSGCGTISLQCQHELSVD